MAENAQNQEQDQAVEAAQEAPKPRNAEAATNNNVEVAGAQAATKDAVQAYTDENFIGELADIPGFEAVVNDSFYSRAIGSGIDSAQADRMAAMLNRKNAEKFIALSTGEIEHPSLPRVANLPKGKKAAFLNTVAYRYIGYMDSHKQGLSRSKRNSLKKARNIKRFITAAGNNEVALEALGSAINDAYTALGYYSSSNIAEFNRKTNLKDEEGKDVSIKDALAKVTDGPEDPVLAAIAQQFAIEDLASDGDEDTLGRKTLLDLIGDLPRPVATEKTDQVLTKEQELAKGLMDNIQLRLKELKKAQGPSRRRKKREDQNVQRTEQISTQLEAKNQELSNIESQLTPLKSELNSIGQSARRNDLEEERQRRRRELADLIAPLEASKARLEKAIQKLEQDQAKYEAKANEIANSALDSDDKLDIAGTEFVELVKQGVSAMEDALKSSNVTNLDDYKAYKALKDLVDGLSSQSTSEESVQDAQALVAHLTYSRIHELDREITKINTATAEKRLFTPNELALALLQKKYEGQGLSSGDARIMAGREIVQIRRRGVMQEFFKQAQEARQSYTKTGQLRTFARVFEARVAGNAVFVNAKAGMKLLVDAGNFSEEAKKTLKGIGPDMNHNALREHLKAGGISWGDLSNYKYQIMSLLGEAKTKDGRKITLKELGHVAEVEHVVDIVDRILSEMTVMEIEEEYKSQVALDKKNDTAEKYAEMFTASSEAQFAMEAAQASTSLTEGKEVENLKNAKDISAYLLKNLADGGKWSAKKLGQGLALPVTIPMMTWKNRKEIYEFSKWMASRPFVWTWAVAKSPFKVVNWGADKVSLAVGNTLFSVSTFAARLLMSPLGIFYAMYKGAVRGYEGVRDAGRAQVIDVNTARVQARTDEAEARAQQRIAGIQERSAARVQQIRGNAVNDSGDQYEADAA